MLPPFPVCTHLVPDASASHVPQPTAPLPGIDLAIAEEASQAGEVPTAKFLDNGEVTCETTVEWDDDDGDSDSGSDDGDTSSTSSTPPCSGGSVCLDGDLGVYCQCYKRISTSEEVKTPAWRRISLALFSLLFRVKIRKEGGGGTR